MAGQQVPRSSSSELNPRDPQFPQKAALSSSQTQSELMETIAVTRQTIARAKAALAEADRLLGKS